VELTVVMPCLNEAETVATCVRKAVSFLREHDIDGEVLVADNGSTDGSQELATEAGARVLPVSEKGYGNALMGGIIAAHGTYVIMGDADDSYDFTNLMPFIEQLRDGADLHATQFDLGAGLHDQACAVRCQRNRHRGLPRSQEEDCGQRGDADDHGDQNQRPPPRVDAGVSCASGGHSAIPTG